MHCNKFRKLRPLSVSADQNIISVSENSSNSGQMEAVKLPSISGPSHAKGLRPHPPPQKKVKSVGAHRNIISVSKNSSNSGQIEAVLLSSIPGPSDARGLRPHPPPQKKVNGSRLSAEEQFQLFGLGSREDRTGVEVRAFIKERRQGCSSQGETRLLPRWKFMELTETISDYKAKVLERARFNIDTMNAMEALQTEAQQISQEERKVAQKELAANQDWADAEAAVCDWNLLKSEQKAQDALVTRLRLENEKKALLRKNYDVEDMIEVEELRLSEACEQAERAERDRKLSPEEAEKLTWDIANGMSLNKDEVKVLRQLRNENDRLKHYMDRMEEEKQDCTLRIKEEEKRENAVKAEVEMISSDKRSRRMKRQTEMEQLCEELAKLQEVCGEPGYSSAYPLMILQQFEDCIFDSLDLIEIILTERLRKMQKQICRQYEIREQEQKRVHFDALLEERRQKRLARELCPTVKSTGKKLMPRSQPPKSIRKRKEPVQTKNGKESC